MKKICITSSSYVLLIYILLNNKDFKETLYITGENLIKNKEVKNIKILKISIFPNIINRVINYVYFSILLKGKQKYVVYGQDHLSASNFFVEKYEFRVIEDGLSFNNDYITRLKKNFSDENRIKRFVRKLLKINCHHALDERIKKIYVSNLDTLSKEYSRKKIECFNINELWKDIGNSKKEEIKNFFNIDDDVLHQTSYKDTHILLLTQPLSEDGYITEREKINIYSKIIKDNYKNILIKPHPRELTNYQNYFKNIILLDKDIPIELYSLLGMKFYKVVSLFSTSVFNSFMECDREVLGTVENKKLELEFGKIEYSFIKAKKE